MLKNYLTIAFRNLWKHKGFTAINVLGLAVGLACCLLIFLYVSDELSYDRFHEGADRLYRVTSVLERSSGEQLRSGTTSPPLVSVLEAEFPEVQAALRLWSWPVIVHPGGEALRETVHFADSSFFEVFSFPLRYGNPSQVLASPDHVVLSAKAAEKYFGSENPVGKTLSIKLGEAYQPFTVSGVAERLPSNSSIQFDLLVPFGNAATVRGREYVESWVNFAITTFALLHEGAQASVLETKLSQLNARYLPGDFPMHFAGLQPLTDIHLQPEVSGSNGVVAASKPIYSYVLSGVALLILLIACINFMNLTMGRSLSRAREVGVRKVAGAERWQLMMQFWGEALLLSAGALLLGMAVAGLFLPTFNSLAGKELSLAFLDGGAVLLASAGFVLLTGLVAGGYPALVLSGYSPVESLRGQLRVGGSNAFTKGLVVVQFALSVFLIASLVVMSAQIDYLDDKDLGYDDTNLVGIQTNSAPGERLLATFRNELAGRSGIHRITGSSGSEFETPVAVRGDTFDTHHDRVDFGYLETFGVKLKEGRSFSRQFATDSTKAVVVNEAFVERAGLEDPVGKTIGFNYGAVESPTIVGVVEDFHFQSLHEPIRPLVLHLNPEGAVGMIWVKVRPDDISGTLALLEDTWHRAASGLPFSYQFMDEANRAQYQEAARWRKIIGYASLFALLIACLGLFGLTALTVKQRTKEIGIRKVLGASTASIAALLSRHFLKLVLLGIVLATPAAYLAAERWLEGFAYQVDLGPWIFIGASALALLVALLTVSYQAVRAALMDPVKSLRYE